MTKKIIRLTEADLTRLVQRVIKEQYNRTFQDTDGIPCIKQNFVFQTYKITNPKLLSKLQGKLSSKPVLSEKNVLVYDKTNISLPDKKLGTVTFYSNGNKVGAMSLDNTSFGGELYSIVEKNYVDQGSDQFKIGWVFCNGALYLYDIFGEKEEKNEKK